LYAVIGGFSASAADEYIKMPNCSYEQQRYALKGIVQARTVFRLISSQNASLTDKREKRCLKSNKLVMQIICKFMHNACACIILLNKASDASCITYITG